MSHKANPARSGLSAVHHLFRHLDDAKELRRNPLVALAFLEFATDGTQVEKGLATTLRREIATISEELAGARDHQGDASFARGLLIINRCLLAGEPWQVVARDLGVSRRQYMRDKARACKPVALRLRDRLIPVTAGSTGFSLTSELNAAAVLAENGEARPAIRSMLKIAGECSSPRTRILAIASAARISARLGHDALTRECSAQLRTHVHSIETAGPERDFVRGVLFLVKSTESFERGICAEPRKLILCSIGLLRRSVGLGVDGANAPLADALIESGQQYLLSGMLSEAEIEFGEALECLDLVPHVANALRVDALTRLAEALDAQGKPSSVVQKTLTAARVLAIQSGLTSRLVLANSVLSQHLCKTKGYAACAALMSDCIAWARRIGNRKLAAKIYLAAGDVLLSSESAVDFSNARRLLHIVANASSQGSYAWVVSRFLLAAVELSRRKAREALPYALDADAGASKLGLPRLRAAALRYHAEVRASLGQQLKAKELIVECLDIAGRFAPDSSLSLCYSTAAAITGDAQYERVIHRSEAGQGRANQAVVTGS